MGRHHWHLFLLQHAKELCDVGNFGPRMLPWGQLDHCAPKWPYVISPGYFSVHEQLRSHPQYTSLHIVLLNEARHGHGACQIIRLQRPRLSKVRQLSLGSIDEDIGCLQIAMDHSWLIVVNVVQSFQNLHSVPLNYPLMQWPETSQLARQRVRHQLHEDRSLILLNHTAIVLDNVLMVEASEELALMKELLLKIFILGLNDFNCELGRNVELVRWALASGLIQALVHDSKGTFPQFLPPRDRLELGLPFKVDYHTLSMVQAAVFTVHIVGWFPRSSQLEIHLIHAGTTVIKLEVGLDHLTVASIVIDSLSLDLLLGPMTWRLQHLPSLVCIHLDYLQITGIILLLFFSVRLSDMLG